MSGPVPAPYAPRRSRGRRIALVVWLVVLLALAVPTVWAAISYSSQPEDQRVPAAGGEVTIEQPGEYAVYAETTSSSTGSHGGLASVTAPSGAALAVEPPGMSENYNYDDRVATRIGTFAASEPGTYGIVGKAEGTAPGDELVVGTRTVGSLLGVVFGAFATGIVLVAGLVGGLVMLLAGRRRLPPPPPGGVWPPAGAPQWPGQPGAYGPYGPPPGQAPPWSAPPGTQPAWPAPPGTQPARSAPPGTQPAWSVPPGPHAGGPPPDPGRGPYRQSEDPTGTVRPDGPDTPPRPGDRA